MKKILSIIILLVVIFGANAQTYIVKTEKDCDSRYGCEPIHRTKKFVINPQKDNLTIYYSDGKIENRQVEFANNDGVKIYRHVNQTVFGYFVCTYYFTSDTEMTLHMESTGSNTKVVLVYTFYEQEVPKQSNNEIIPSNVYQALNQFVAFCKIQIDIENMQYNPYTTFCINILEITDNVFTKEYLKSQMDKVLTDKVIQNQFLTSLSKISRNDYDYLLHLIRPPQNPTSFYVTRVSEKDAVVLTKYIISTYQLKEEKYQKHINDAKNALQERKYAKAIECYQDAAKIKPEELSYVVYEIEKINEILKFLIERPHQVYNYADINPENYKILGGEIGTIIKNILLEGFTLPVTTLDIIFSIDTLGATTCSITPLSDTMLTQQLKHKMETIELGKSNKYGYAVFAEAKYEYRISADKTILTFKKDAKKITSTSSDFEKYSSDINNITSSFPIGKYNTMFCKATINGMDYYENKILNYKGAGGPVNVLFEFLVPGLGVKPVTGGLKNGLGITLTTYGLIGAGVGCKLWSDSEYKKYHKATTQDAMDKHYQKANTLNQSFYGFMVAGGIVWVSNIIRVGVIGGKNKKIQQAWSNSHLSLYYEPQFNSQGITYLINF